MPIEMNTRAVVLCLFTIAIGGVSPDPAWAQCGCGYVGLAPVINRPDMSAVFSGTVAEVEALGAVLLVTFDVDGIWKGDVSKRAFVYRPIHRPAIQGGTRIVRDTGSGDSRPFEIGKRYLVTAHVLSAQEQAEFSVDVRPGSLAVETCGGFSRPFEVFANYDLKEMGPGRKPR
jgi:hypothetical protein